VLTGLMTEFGPHPAPDPRLGQPVEPVPGAEPADVERAVVLARAAAPGWAGTSAVERAAALRAAAAALRARAGELAGLQTAETGRLIAEAHEGVLAGAAVLELYAELGPQHRGRGRVRGRPADLVLPQPRGLVVALTPWNDPVAVACGLLGAALASGNVVVHKPSERAARTGRTLTALLAEHFPPDVLAGLSGGVPVGAALARHAEVDVVAHVGSTAAGRSVARAAALTGAKALLADGGNDAMVVDEDVDPRWAAGQAALGAFGNSGQLRTSVERIYLHQRIAEEFLAALIDEARRRVPEPRQPTELPLGPLVDRRRRDLVHEQVRDALEHGAWLLAGGERPAGPGSSYPATVLSECTAVMRVLREKTFGPVAPVRTVADFDQGLTEAAGDARGRCATVLTSSMAHAQQAWRRLPVGTVRINAVFGGAAQAGRAGGDGFGDGPELLDELTVTRAVHLSAPGG
jgi:betaine-aldehyde dehydrogenase